jgi:hypothetical protein
VPSRRARALGAALLALLLPRAARAEAPSPAAPSVAVHAATSELVANALADRLRPRLQTLGVDLAIDVVGPLDVDAILSLPEGPDDAPLAQVWLDERSRAEATLFLVPRRTDRVLARRIALGDGFDEVSLAEVVYIVERSVIALLAAQPVGVPRAKLDPSLRPAVAAPPDIETPTVVEPPPATESPPASEPSPAAERASDIEPPLVEAAPAPVTSSFQGGVFAGGEAWAAGRDALLDAGGLVAFERVHAWGRVGLALDASLRREVVSTTPHGTLRLDGGGGHLWFTLGRRLGRAGTGHLLVGPGLSVNELGATPSTSAPQLTARSRTDVDGSLGVLLRWDIPLYERWGLFVAVGADVAFVTARYTLVAGDTSTPLVPTWPVKPLLRLGLVLGGR